MRASRSWMPSALWRTPVNEQDWPPGRRAFEQEPALVMRRGDCGHRDGGPDVALWARGQRKLAS